MTGQTLLRVMHVKQLYETSFSEFGLNSGLTLLEMNIMLFLENHAEYNTARDLCNLCMIPKSNASNGIRLLERKGLLRIEFDTMNKKIHRLFLTEKAREFVEELKQIMGFPKDYILVGTQSEQKKYIGNAVEVNMARSLCEALAKSINKM